MHLLFATSLVPDVSPATGYDIANAAIVAAMRRVGVRVTVMGYAWPGREVADPDDTIVLGELDVRNETASLGVKARWTLGALTSGMTVSSYKMLALPRASVSHVLDHLGAVDAYVLNAVQFAGAFGDLFASKPFAFVAHNVEHRSAEENAAAARSPLQRWLFAREARLLKTLELELCRRARHVFTLAEGDRAPLGVSRDDRSSVLPLVTRTAPYRARRTRKVEADAVLLGTWTWQPNRIGLEWFLEAVTPHLPADFRVRIGGAIPAGMVPSRAGVEFVGRVADATEFVRSGAAVALVSQAGTGVQLKTIEAFELGLPCVATPKSLRGVDMLPSNCSVAEEPRAFARALVQTAKMGREIDGAGFFEAQRASLDRRVRFGLSRLGHVAAREFA
ncbi:MAG: glycosyltransferase [Rhizobiaceae bacterium]